MPRPRRPRPAARPVRHAGRPGPTQTGGPTGGPPVLRSRAPPPVVSFPVMSLPRSYAERVGELLVALVRRADFLTFSVAAKDYRVSVTGPGGSRVVLGRG